MTEHDSLDGEVRGGRRVLLLLTGCVLLGGAAVLLAKPELLAFRFAAPHGVDLGAFHAACLQVVTYAVPLPLCLVAALVIIHAWGGAPSRRRVVSLLTCLSLSATYLAASLALSDWIVDDAAITFAYADNLAEGHGLVLYPGAAREEAYSNTLWLLLLALVRALGGDIPTAAKILCTIIGLATMTLAWLTSRKLHLEEGHSPLRVLLLAAVALGSPYIVWSVSGLEHAMQGFLFVVIAASPLLTKRHVALVTLCLCLLILLRPETPLVVACVAAAYGVVVAREKGLRGLLTLWPIVVVPAVVLAAFIAFRMAYFGDPLPNPYYVKASEATFLRLVNVLGGGWDYVLGWLGRTGAFVLVPILALGTWRKAPLPVLLAAAVAVAQLVFMIYSGGDWMAGWRFVSPMLPVLAILTVHAVATSSASPRPRREAILIVIVAICLAVGTLKQLAEFRASPTTPFSVVQTIGREFEAVAEELDIEAPVLAHHDAGGTSYQSSLRLVDLAGLGDRTLAKHMDDSEFVYHYLFEQKRPHFFFGVTTGFAAGRTRFHERPEFSRDYIPMEFPGKRHMVSGLCHIRRDVARESERIDVVEENGRPVKVVVR